MLKAVLAFRFCCVYSHLHGISPLREYTTTREKTSTRTHPRCWLYRPFGRVLLQKAPRRQSLEKAYDWTRSLCCPMEQHARQSVYV